MKCASSFSRLTGKKISISGKHRRKAIFITEGSGGGARSTAAVARVEGVGPGGPARRPLRLLRTGPAGLPDLQAKPPTPQRVVDPGVRCSTRRPTSERGSRSSCTTASWSTGRCSATARTSVPTTRPTTCAGRRTSSRVRTAAAARTARACARSRLPHQPLRRADGDRAAHRRAGGGAPAADRALQPLLLRADDEARAAAEGHHRSQGAGAAHRVLRVDRVGGVDRAARPELLVHQQLAARAPRRQQADRERDRLERAVADRAAGRDRHPLRRLRTLALPRLARARAGDAVVPLARGRGADAGAARDARGSSS